MTRVEQEVCTKDSIVGEIVEKWSQELIEDTQVGGVINVERVMMTMTTMVMVMAMAMVLSFVNLQKDLRSHIFV